MSLPRSPTHFFLCYFLSKFLCPPLTKDTEINCVRPVFSHTSITLNLCPLYLLISFSSSSFSFKILSLTQERHGECGGRGFVCPLHSASCRQRGKNESLTRSMMPAGDSWERQFSKQSTWNTVDQESSLFSWLSSHRPSLRYFLLGGEAERETLGARFPPGEWAGFTQQAPAPNLGSLHLAGLEKSPHLKLRHGSKKAGGDVALPERLGRDFCHIPQSFN